MANEDKSTRYQRLRRRGMVAALVSDLALPAIALVSGLAQAASRGLGGAAGGVAAVAALALAGAVLRQSALLVIALATERAAERRYASHPTPGTVWIRARLARALTGGAALVAAALVVHLCQRVAFDDWWVLAAGAVFASVALAVYGVPAWTLPDASALRPLSRPALAARLSTLASRAGLGPVEVLEWRTPEATPHPAAVLVGAGARARVLVADDVLATHADDEVEVMVAHELAHRRHHDVWSSGVLVAAVAAAALWAAARVLAATGGWLGLDGVADPAGLLLVGLVVRGVFALSTPLVNVWFRAQERRADHDALQWTGNARALIRALRRLSAAHLVEDRPPSLFAAVMGRHPAVAERIAAAEAWQQSAAADALTAPAPGPTRR